MSWKYVRFIPGYIEFYYSLLVSFLEANYTFNPQVFIFIFNHIVDICIFLTVVHILFSYMHFHSSKYERIIMWKEYVTLWN